MVGDSTGEPAHQVQPKIFALRSDIYHSGNREEGKKAQKNFLQLSSLLCIAPASSSLFAMSSSCPSISA
jgi:hypothetical protein